MCYNIIMKNVYNTTKTTVSLIRYHFVFCPRYRRKIFLIDGVEDAFKKYTLDVCTQNRIEILAMECHKDHVHMFVSAYPDTSPADLMNVIKGATSRVLRQDFPVLSAMPSLWTRSYFVSTTGNVSAETIQRYVESQKKTPKEHVHAYDPFSS